MQSCKGDRFCLLGEIMKIKILGIITLCLQIPAIVSSDIIVKYADVIWTTTADSSADLIDVTSSVTPRITFEYANSNYPRNLDVVPTDLVSLIDKVSPRLIIVQANSNDYEELIFPVGLINDTISPIISNVTVTNITGSSATIRWDTDEIANSLAKYGESPGVYTKTEEDPLFVTSHSIVINGLSEETRYYFVVNSTDRSGNSSESQEYDFIATGVEELQIPATFYLSQNYPNPAISGTYIEYTLPRNTKVTIRIYDITGRIIHTLVTGKQTPGIYKIHWDDTDSHGNRVAPGVYFYRMQAGDFVTTKKLTILR